MIRVNVLKVDNEYRLDQLVLGPGPVFWELTTTWGGKTRLVSICSVTCPLHVSVC